ncbi:MAG: hypothetical protein KIT58_13735 [Planctomycetota bacterium]|nr:hypothetical protein [Planctomycetota bacterium]
MTELDHGAASAPGPHPGDPDPAALHLRRRTLLRRALAGAAVVGLGGLTVTQGLGYDLAADLRGGLQALSAKEFLVLEAACRRILDGLDEAAPRAAALWADGYLARQAPWVRSDVRLLLHAFEHTPPVLSGSLSRFTRLAPDRQDAHLNAWRLSGLTPLKQGFAALKGLAFMGGYRRAAALRAIGYDGPAGA